MFRITATLVPGHDMESVVFMLRAPNVAMALQAAMRALAQMGFDGDTYSLTNSRDLLRY